MRKLVWTLRIAHDGRTSEMALEGLFRTLSSYGTQLLSGSIIKHTILDFSGQQ